MIQSQLLEYIYNLLWLSCPVQLSIAICLAMLTSFNFIPLSVGLKISAQNIHRTCVHTWGKKINTISMKFKLLEKSLFSERANLQAAFLLPKDFKPNSSALVSLEMGWLAGQVEKNNYFFYFWSSGWVIQTLGETSMVSEALEELKDSKRRAGL